jgi:hypothetical protein
MSITKLDYTTLRRSSPDPAAPSTPAGPLLALFNTITAGGVLLSLPFVIPYTIIKHIVVGPRAKWMNLRAHLLSNIIRIVLIRLSYFLPGRDGGEWDIPFLMRKGCSSAPGVKATIVRLQPATTPREGFAICPAVLAAEVPGFMLAPPGVGGASRAKEGEKAILYFVGG